MDNALTESRLHAYSRTINKDHSDVADSLEADRMAKTRAEKIRKKKNTCARGTGG